MKSQFYRHEYQQKKVITSSQSIHFIAEQTDNKMSSLPTNVKPFSPSTQNSDNANNDVKCKIESVEDATKSELELSCECTNLNS